MTGRRVPIAVVLGAVLAAGAYVAFLASRLYLYRQTWSGSYTYILLFKSAPWAVLAAAAVGTYYGASVGHREEPEIKNGKVLRHDEVAFMEHWTHASSTVLLLATGVALGFLFIPRLVVGAQTVGFMLNLHFVGVLVFMFGNFYYVANALVHDGFKEHLPQFSDFQGAMDHYMAKAKGMEPAPDGKYIASERLAYLGFAVAVFGIVATGSVKVLAHVFSLPGWLMGAMTFLHDFAALGMLGMLAMHILMSSVVPWSWPLLGSILTGYVSEEYVRTHHLKWFEELRRGGSKEPSKKPAPDKGKGMPVTQ